MKTTKIIYWICTGLISALFLMSAFMYLGKSPQLVQAFTASGIPQFFIPLLGVAKLLGAIAIVNPWFRGLKEWSYAGFTFVLIGATWVHVSTATPFIMPLVFLAVLAVSYLYYRKLGTIKPSAAHV